MRYVEKVKSKIINGKKYDVAESRWVGLFENSSGITQEELYHKKGDVYFLVIHFVERAKPTKAASNLIKSAVESGKFHEHLGGIIPIHKKTAMDWMAEVYSAERYEKEFGKFVEEE